MTFGRNLFLMFCFAFYGCAILLFTEAAIKVVPVSYYYYYNGHHPQQQFVQYANLQQSNNRMENFRVMNGNPKTNQWNTNPSPKDKDDAWDIKENQQKMKQPKQQTDPISQNSIQKQQQTDNYESVSSNQIQPNQRTDQYQPVLSNQFQQKQQHTDQSKPVSTNQIQPDHRSDTSQPISQQNMSGNNNNNNNNNKYTPWNVHNNYYTSYDDCDPWCRAHCATKRTPEFCFRTGPCMHNCYRIVTNFLRARRM